ncbi:MAG TPA: putative Ig domain-containing protein [Acetobacteraceae bacterium]|nr:putative Ig domain-containing protein [Acetobacteraceae bacterium]
MAISDNETAFVNNAAASIGLAEMFNITPASTNPPYLVLTVLDRDEYTVGATGATGTLTGNGRTLSLSNLGGDGRGGGIVFTYQASTGLYYNSTYGYLNQLVYDSSASAGDVTNLSLFGESSLAMANAYAGNADLMMQKDAAGYIGSATVVTRPGYTATVPSQATPDSIVSAAQSFVGQAWNDDGCWLLASTIAAEAGASLPVQSTLIGLPGQANGEWIVAFNGPAGQTGNWQSMVTAGEMIVFEPAGGGGHITTCVSGSGGSAMLVDNITYVGSGGQITNLANDGSGSDIVVSAPHPASQEFAGVSAATVVIYELDTPIVTTNVASDGLVSHASQSLGVLFSATDPGNKTITSWQIYDTATTDALILNGVDYSDHSAANALTASSLSAVSLLAGATATTDTLEVRAYNGNYWGDWDSLSVAITTTTIPTAAPPVLTVQTPNQTWKEGQAISLALGANTFTDPLGETLSYSATLANGQSLPSWLKFNAATDSFSGIPPNTAQTLSIKVTATDTSGLAASDSFTATVLGAPVVAAPTPNQTWFEGKAFSLALAANTFVDPQGESLTCTATQTNGQALPSWLQFNAATDSFSGTAPSVAQSVAVNVTATDSGGLSASESFTATVQAPAPTPGITVTNPTPNQTWADGQAVGLTLPANTFADALGLKMTFAAYELSGPNVTSWLYFNPNADEFFGVVPAQETGRVLLAVLASDAQHMTAEDMFSVTFAPNPTSHSTASISALGIVQPPDPSHVAGLLVLHG